MNSLNKLHNALENTQPQHDSDAEPVSDREQALQTACDILLDYALAVKRATELTVETEEDKIISNESNSHSQIEALHEALNPLQIPNLDRAGQPTHTDSHVGGVPDDQSDLQESLQSSSAVSSTVQGSPCPTTAASSFVPDDVDNDTRCSVEDTEKLKYHHDATDIRFDGRHLFRPDALTQQPRQSRRVLLGGLPADIKLPQLMLGLREIKGILSVILIPPRLSYPTSWNGALVELDCCESATTFLQIVNERPPRYADARGLIVSVEAKLIDTNSYHATHWSMVSPSTPRSRTVCFPDVNRIMAWHICRALPFPRQIVAIEYAESIPCLYVQFSSVFTATVAWEACNYGRLQTDEFWRVKVVCHCAPDSIFNQHTAEYVPQVATNLEALLQDVPLLQPPKFPLQAPPLHLNMSISCGAEEMSDSDRYYLSEMQPALRRQSDQAYTKKTLEQLAEERKKMLQESKWDAYGKLARHRRELTTKEDSTSSHTAASCDGSCQFKCRPLRSAPPADVIKNYLSIHQPSYADTGIKGY